MKVVAKVPISTGDGKGGRIVIAKGTVGQCIAVTNRISQSFPNLSVKENGWYYLVKFPDHPEMLVGRSQLEI